MSEKKGYNPSGYKENPILAKGEKIFQDRIARLTVGKVYTIKELSEFLDFPPSQIL